MEQTLNIYNFKEINNNNIKNSIINIIYQELNMYNYRYQLLDSKNIDVLKKETFYITPHIIGTNCWIVYYSIANVKYHVILYKKDLKQMKNQININFLKVFTFDYFNKTGIYNDLYNLTILEGKFIPEEINNPKPIFLIQDMLIYSGQKILTKNIPDKIKLIEQLLPILNNGLDNKFSIKLSGIYIYDQIGDLIFNKIKNSKFKINGLIFLPEKSGRNIIYLNDNEFMMLRNGTPNEFVCKEYSSLSVPSIPLQMSHKNKLDKHLINDFVLRKTNITDVFEIYKYEIKEKIYTNLTNNNYIGIAHVPDMKTSHYCKMLGDKYEIFVNKCNYNYKFRKWSVIIEPNKINN